MSCFSRDPVTPSDGVTGSSAINGVVVMAVKRSTCACTNSGGPSNVIVESPNVIVALQGSPISHLYGNYNIKSILYQADEWSDGKFDSVESADNRVHRRSQFPVNPLLSEPASEAMGRRCGCSATSHGGRLMY